MTQTLDPVTARPMRPAGSASTRGSPTSRRPSPPATRRRAPALFATECYWRDLVAFTWNLKTVEGRDGVADLLGAAGRRASAPSGFATTEPPDEADGVVTAWFRFETASAAATGCSGSRRGRRGRLDASSPRSTSSRATRSRAARHRPMGAQHGAVKDRVTWKERRQRGGGEPRQHRRSPTSW